MLIALVMASKQVQNQVNCTDVSKIPSNTRDANEDDSDFHKFDSNSAVPEMQTIRSKVLRSMKSREIVICRFLRVLMKYVNERELATVPRTGIMPKTTMRLIVPK